MIAVAIMGGLTLVVMEMMKQQSKQTVSSRISGDLSQMKSEIQAYLTSPTSCDANFYGATATSDAPAAVYKCTSGACLATPGTGSSVARYQSTSTTWYGDSSRVRINAIQRSVVSSTATATHPILTTATLKVSFQSLQLNIAAGGSTVKQENDATYVVPVVWNGTKVIGCPQTIGSTSLPL